ncbi:Hypothetical Protein FCC1311_036112 [Hondaea fermentalgiana]|uniref:Uncharacterized protein n=1 Tax=Hondaea fermentalgiana TaxID=2315210 RepID=A0A2R5GAQ1_9STRA|nr:Hypothetical Protein FCC1311_036112 [Hondaea fermentalgiana]|eukprot:GBG27389.1 Hypothetical Protein FCC1311_036112 [Hondaea fermentalgiana]
MYFIAVLVNIVFCAGLTLQMFLRRKMKPEPFIGLDGGDPTRARMLREANERLTVLQSAIRKQTHERRSVHRKLEEERRVREKLRSKLEEEKLLRANMQASLRAAQAKLLKAEEERDSLQSIVSLLCANTGTLENLVTELRTAKTNLPLPQNIIGSNTANPPATSSSSSLATSPTSSHDDILNTTSHSGNSTHHTSSDARSQASFASVDSLMMKSCISYGSSRYPTSTSNASVRMDEFFEPGTKQSDLYNAFETESDSESMSN